MFSDLAKTHPDVRFEWLDIEEQAERLGDLDVENFPTVLIGIGGEPVFYGTLLPHIQTLDRLLQGAKDLRPLPAGPETPALQALLD